MSRKKSKPKNSGRIDRRQETRNKRASGTLAYLAYQIHAEQKLEDRAEVRESRIEGGISHE